MDYLITLFGGIPLSNVIIFLAAMLFVIPLCIKGYKLIVKWHDKRQEREEVLQKITNNLIEVKEEQKALRELVNELHSRQQEIANRQEEIEKQHNQYSLNKLRSYLIKAYYYYTDDNNNPLHAWSEMEKEAFDNLFRDYEALGGNGYMHSTVQPAMLSLEVVSMANVQRLAEVSASRKKG